MERCEDCYEGYTHESRFIVQEELALVLGSLLIDFARHDRSRLSPAKKADASQRVAQFLLRSVVKRAAGASLGSSDLKPIVVDWTAGSLDGRGEAVGWVRVWMNDVKSRQIGWAKTALGGRRLDEAARLHLVRLSVNDDPVHQ